MPLKLQWNELWLTNYSACRAAAEGDKDTEPCAKRAKVFEEHLKFSAVANGIKSGELVQGKLTTQRKYPFEGTVSAGKQVRVSPGACSMETAGTCVYL